MPPFVAGFSYDQGKNSFFLFSDLLFIFPKIGFIEFEGMLFCFPPPPLPLLSASSSLGLPVAILAILLLFYLSRPLIVIVVHDSVLFHAFGFVNVVVECMFYWKFAHNVCIARLSL